MLSSSSSGQHEVSQVIIPSYTTGSRLTASRILNIFVITLFVLLVILHTVSIIVLEKKQDELVTKFRDHVSSMEDHCILFINHESDASEQELQDQWMFANKNCHLVIHGSQALTGCATLMVIFLGVRTILYKRDNLLGILDGVEVIITGLFAGFIAVVVTLGKNKTCKTLEDESNAHCKDAMITHDDQHIRVYNALLTAEVMSWLAVTVMCLITMVTGIRLLLWAMNRCCHASITSGHGPLLEHNYLLNLHTANHAN